MRKAVVVTVATLVFVTGCKGKPKLEAKIVGYKAGSKDIILVHAKATKGSKLWCGEGGYGCDIYIVPASGETEFEVDLGKGRGDTPKKVMVNAELGKNHEIVPLDLEKDLPPALDISANGYVSCKPRDCAGNFNFITGQAELYLPAGTVATVGSSKITSDSTGKAFGPITLTTPVKDIPLSKLCAKDKTSFGSTPVSITFPDKTTLTGKLDVTSETITAGLNKVLGPVMKGTAVTFPWEKGAPAKGKIAIRTTLDSCQFAGAPDGKIGDIRVYVIGAGDQKTRTGECSYTSDKGTHATAKITMHDESATAYDRTTGKTLGTKAFEASKACDANVYGTAGFLSEQDRYVSEATMLAWGATLAR